MGAASVVSQPILLLSAPRAAETVGPSWFQAVVEEGRTEFPNLIIRAMLDCGDSPGYALAALRHGIKYICFDGHTADKIADISNHFNAKLFRSRPESLDLYKLELAGSQIGEACQAWLLETN